MVLRLINILVGSAVLIFGVYKLSVDSGFELFPNSFLYLTTLMFLLFAIETFKEGRKVYGSLVSLCFAVSMMEVIKQFVSVV